MLALLGQDYIRLTKSFVKEVLEAYEKWETKTTVPARMKELMMVLEIELSRNYVTTVIIPNPWAKDETLD